MNPAIMRATISALALVLYQSGVFDRLKKIVERQEAKAKNDPSLTGDAKFEMAISEAKFIGLKLSGWLLNLGIEMAVAYIKSAKL